MIRQARFAKSVRFFEKGFLQRWEVSGYQDLMAPCFFAGCYNQEDADLINNHKGFKVLWITHILPDKFHQMLNPKDIIIMKGNGMPCDVSKDFKVKECNMEIKDFSKFIPGKLGNQVYCYVGNEFRKEYYGIELAKELERKIPFKIKISLINKHRPETLTEQYIIGLYRDCFVNLQLSGHGGRIGIMEMAHMGINSIVNGNPYDFCIGYKDMDEIIEAINKEAVKIGTIQPSLFTNHFTKDWQQIKFWE